MQFAKDSFYVALRERLSSLNPERVSLVNGINRIAIVVAENEPIAPVTPVPNTFYLEWKAPKVLELQGGKALLLAMDCVISFTAEGSTQTGVDRGRILAQLTSELLAISYPEHASKRDFAQTPSLDLGTKIFWTAPRFDDSPCADDAASAAYLRRTAALTVFFFSELELS